VWNGYLSQFQAGGFTESEHLAFRVGVRTGEEAFDDSDEPVEPHETDPLTLKDALRHGARWLLYESRQLQPSVDNIDEHLGGISVVTELQEASDSKLVEDFIKFVSARCKID
jgi:hypothetical protein